MVPLPGKRGTIHHKESGALMDDDTPHIEVRAVHVDDAPALYELDNSFETDRIYTLQVCNHLIQNGYNGLHEENISADQGTFVLKLVEIQVDPPLYRDYRETEPTVEAIEARLRAAEGGFVALTDGRVAGCILLDVDDEHSVARIQGMRVGRQFRRYDVGSLLLNCAIDWARKQKCWALLLETQNTNYPAIQFYLRHGLEIWGINQHFYPPGATAHQAAIFMGKRLSPLAEV